MEHFKRVICLRANTKAQNIHNRSSSHNHKGNPEEDPNETNKREEINPELETKSGSESTM